MLYPLTFHPIFKERVWGGRQLETHYHKQLPLRIPIGESWEITDRPEGISVIANGPLAGKSLRWLMENHAVEALGKARTLGERFPLLIKILDAQETLSLQVHPPANLAAVLGGEPKTEMWYIADAKPGAALFVGLKRGMTRAQFEAKIYDGTVADCFHRVKVKPGDAMFLPSGRVHAIGAGNLIFEIQQNSDTTYRVFDWNRVGLDGLPRELHVAQSLAAIDFADFEPALIEPQSVTHGPAEVRRLVQDPLFSVDLVQLPAGQTLELGGEAALVLGVIEGQMRVGQEPQAVLLNPGRFCLLPACLGRTALEAATNLKFLTARPG